MKDNEQNNNNMVKNALGNLFKAVPKEKEELATVETQETETAKTEQAQIILPDPKELLDFNTRTFNENSEKIKRFGENVPNTLVIKPVEKKKGWFHSNKITAADLNTVIGDIQGKMINQNQSLIHTIKEFSTIYETFNNLDKEYIDKIKNAIIIAFEANRKAMLSIEGLLNSQNDIQNLVNQQETVVAILQKFHNEIKDLKHITKVDTIFDDVVALQNNAAEISEKLDNYVQITNRLQDDITSLSDKHNNLGVSVDELKKESVDTAKRLEKAISDNKEAIEKADNAIKSASAQLSEKMEQMVANQNVLINSLQTNITDIKTESDSRLEQMTVRNDNQDSYIKYLEGRLDEANARIDELDVFSKKLFKLQKLFGIVAASGIATVLILVILIIGGIL